MADMTDLDTFREMLKRAGIEYEESSYQNEGTTVTVIKVESKEGYLGFFTNFTFKLDGSVLTIAAFE